MCLGLLKHFAGKQLRKSVLRYLRKRRGDLRAKEEVAVRG